MNIITFWGAARTVTGSRHLVQTADGRRILLDCGLFQGARDFLPYNRHFGFSPHAVDALILSHAHLDHCGLIPRLCSEGFSGPIFCTAATLELTRLMLQDAASIQEEDTRYINKLRAREGLPPVEPLYTQADVSRCLRLFRPIPFHETFEPLIGIRCTFTVAGHILGSAVVNLELPASEASVPLRLCYTGDLGRYNDDIMLPPGEALPADVVICESTYGDRLHPAETDTAAELLSALEYTCLTKKGVLVIPAFSVGRTQGLLYHLNSLYNSGRLPPVDIFVDSPMAQEATRIVRRFPELYNVKVRRELEKDADVFGFPGLYYVQSHEESKRLNERSAPFVVISASGMADAGRVKHHILHRIGDPRNTILLTGYSEPDSLAARLKSGARSVRIFGKEHKVRCEVQSLQSMSAHGDVHDILRFLEPFRASGLKKLFLVHGMYNAQLHLAHMCRSRGFEHVEIPERASHRML